MGTFDICHTVKVFLSCRSHIWNNNIQASKRLTKVKEKWSAIQFDVFLSFFHFLHSDVPDNKYHKQKGHVLFSAHIKLVVHVLMCVHVIACIKWRSLLSSHTLIIQLFAVYYAFFPELDFIFKVLIC